MPSLADLQRRFAARLQAGAAIGDAGIDRYRRAIRANYRNALAATYPVVRQLTGSAFFDALADAFAQEHPSTSGDLNVYGAGLPAFVAAYPHALGVAYLADIARLEWAIDEAHRAADNDAAPDDVLGELAAAMTDPAAAPGFTLHPSCRLLHATFPVLRIWQAHQAAASDDQLASIDFAGTDEHLLVRRVADEVVINRIDAPDYRLLVTLTAGLDLVRALEDAKAADAAFDLRAALERTIRSGILVGVRATR